VALTIQLLSDLHLECQPDWKPEPAPGADLLVLAGDIGSYQQGSALATLGDPHFGLGRFSPAEGWPCPVLFVPGNHEYDGLDFDEAHQRLQDSCHTLGIHWLEQQTLNFGGVRFIGTTLWSDFDALDNRPDHGRAPGKSGRDKAMRAANYYLQTTGTHRQGKPFLAEQVREQALRSQSWLRHALAVPAAEPTVVVTHFAPSLHSADPRYGMTPGTAGFCNSLDALTQDADLWLHGHLHCTSDYRLGRCRVVANPLGYAEKGEQAAFRPQRTVQIG